MSGLASFIPRAASRRAPVSPSASPRSADEMRYPLPHSKIKNQQSSFINPIFLHWQIVIVQFNSMGDPENGPLP
jgi:hypothetical protein